ncbi:Hypothetical predicted protein [Octopus vulgaris]|uniref:Uncharacterized protein n=1 Tax=Octopus vulgaris TaxID=6645 RepID=A0AA36ATA0_OCTVU|nr:Hypothetical predicted protein [Octopus vulgaris]
MMSQYTEATPSQQHAMAIRGVVIYDSNGTVIRSSLNVPLPRSLLKSLLASFRVPRSRVKTQMFQCYLEGGNYHCMTVNPNVIVGWSNASRFTLNKSSGGIVMVFEDPKSPTSSVTSSEDYAEHLKTFQSVQQELHSPH